MYALLMLFWVVLSMLTMGVACFLLTVIYIVIPTNTIHEMMWWLYVKWVAMLSWLVRKVIKDIEVQGDDGALENKPFILLSNHYSWLDILILYAVVFKENRSFVFVMKRSLIYLPMIGLVCWGLGHPLIDRGSRKDNARIITEAAKKAKQYGYGVMIFPEGSRYTKNVQGHEDYKCLLKPKRLGFNLVSKALGEKVDILDATLIYKDQDHSLWRFLMGAISSVQVVVEQHEVDTADAKQWIMDQWKKKDLLIQKVRHPQSGNDSQD